MEAFDPLCTSSSVQFFLHYTLWEMAKCNNSGRIFFFEQNCFSKSAFTNRPVRKAMMIHLYIRERFILEER